MFEGWMNHLEAKIPKLGGTSCQTSFQMLEERQPDEVDCSSSVPYDQNAVECMAGRRWAGGGARTAATCLLSLAFVFCASSQFDQAVLSILVCLQN